MKRRDFLTVCAAGLLADELNPFGTKKLLKLFGSEADEDRFQLYKHPLAGTEYIDSFGQKKSRIIGHSASIWIDAKNKTLKKIFHTDLPLVNGQPTKFNAAILRSFYQREKDTLIKLREIDSKHIPKNLFFDDKNLTIYMSYMGEDFGIRHHKQNVYLGKWFRTQMISFMEEMQEVGLFKMNNFPSSIIVDDKRDRLYFVGFTQVKPRTEKYLDKEIESLFHIRHLRAVNCMDKLKATFSDFPKDLVDQRFAYFNNKLSHRA